MTYKTSDVVAVLEDKITHVRETMTKALEDDAPRYEALETKASEWWTIHGQEIAAAAFREDWRAVGLLLRETHMPYEAVRICSERQRQRLVADCDSKVREIQSVIALLKPVGPEISHSALKDLGLLPYLRPSRNY